MAESEVTRKKNKRWWFDKNSSRKKLGRSEVKYWVSTLSKLLKVGVELEYNLSDQKGSCRMDNNSCQCVATFKPETLMPKTEMCFEQCSKWDLSLDKSGNPLYPENGNCGIAKEHGCAGAMCTAFVTPCTSCSKYDKGCKSCPSLLDVNKTPANIRKKITAKLQPTKFVGDYGKKGVYQVVKDGSLNGDGGIEVVTVGRRPEFNALHENLKEIMDLCKESEAYVDEKCSIHIHLLASYLNQKGGKGDTNSDFLVGDLTELEQPVPEIILANFHQLIRRYQNALIWMGSSGVSLRAITRWEKFRKPASPYSALRKNMSIVGQEIANSAYKPKYGLINYMPMKYNEEGDITTLHLEARYLDGMMSPAVVAAHAIMVYGLMIKAVELSQHGTLISGTREYMEKQKLIYSNLCNNDSGWGPDRKSDNRNLAAYIPELKEQSAELVRLLKNTMSSEFPAGDILSSLGEKPVSLRRVEDYSWDDIEAQLIAPYEEQLMPSTLQELIDTSYLIGCENSEQWAEQASKEIVEDLDKQDDEAYQLQNLASVRGFLERCVKRGDISWAPDLGTYIRRY